LLQTHRQYYFVLKVSTRKGAEQPPFVAHIVSHGWFKEPKTLWPQLQAMLQVQAIWNDTYIVSAGNHTVGYTVSPTGTILYPEVTAQGEWWQVGVVSIESE